MLEREIWVPNERSTLLIHCMHDGTRNKLDAGGAWMQTCMVASRESGRTHG